MEKETLKFEELPNAVTVILQKVSRLESLLKQKQDNTTAEARENILNIQETANFLNLSVPTIYSKVSRGELPFMKRGKRLYFSSTELMDYLKKGRQKTRNEIEQEADNYLLNKKRLNNG